MTVAVLRNWYCRRATPPTRRLATPAPAAARGTTDDNPEPASADDGRRTRATGEQPNSQVLLVANGHFVLAEDWAVENVQWRGRCSGRTRPLGLPFAECDRTGGSWVLEEIVGQPEGPAQRTFIRWRHGHTHAVRIVSLFHG